MTTTTADETQELFITGLKNAHAVEHQALALMDRQIEHLKSYPEVEEMLRAHRAETEKQIERVDEILASFDTKASAIKDAALTFTGNIAALAHIPAPDEIIKNSLANHAFENFEIAAYTSLLAIADVGGFDRWSPLLQQSLGEEQRMAALVLESVPMITRKYVQLRAAGETAGH